MDSGDARGGGRLFRSGRPHLRPALHLRGLSARRPQEPDDRRRRVLLRRQPRYDRQARGRGHTRRRARRAHPSAGDMDRRIQGGRQDRRRSDASLWARQAARGRRRSGGRDRSRAGARRDRNLEAHVALSHVDGRGLRLRCAISVRRGRAGLFARASAPSRQGLSQLPRRVRAFAARARRRLPGIPRRCRKRRFPGGQDISCRSPTPSSNRS